MSNGDPYRTFSEGRYCYVCPGRFYPLPHYSLTTQTISIPTSPSQCATLQAPPSMDVATLFCMAGPEGRKCGSCQRLRYVSPRIFDNTNASTVSEDSSSSFGGCSGCQNCQLELASPFRICDSFQSGMDGPTSPAIIKPFFDFWDIFTYNGSTWLYELPSLPSQQSDIWAIGCIGYELCIGSHDGDSAQGRLRRYIHTGRYWRAWRHYYVDSILSAVFPVCIVRSHMNDQNSNACCSQSQDFSLMKFKNESRGNPLQLWGNSYLLEDSKRAIGKWTQETPFADDSLNRAWTRVEESLLIEWRAQGKSFVEIGAALGRTDLVVACKYLELVPLPESESDGGMHQDSGQCNSKQKVPMRYAICVYGANYVMGCSVHNGVLDVSWDWHGLSEHTDKRYCRKCECETSPIANGHW